jgi:hypothetical protein
LAAKKELEAISEMFFFKNAYGGSRAYVTVSVILRRSAVCDDEESMTPHRRDCIIYVQKNLRITLLQCHGSFASLRMTGTSLERRDAGCGIVF